MIIHTLVLGVFLMSRTWATSPLTQIQALKLTLTFRIGDI